MRGGCAPTRTFPPLCEDLARARRSSTTEQDHKGAHELRAGTEKIPPVKSGGHHAVYPEACNRQRGAHVALPTDVQKNLPLLVRRPCGTCGTVHNMELALGLTSRLDIGVTMSPCHQERTCKKTILGNIAAHFSLSVVRSHRTWCFVCTARSSPSRRCLTMAARKPARPGRPLIGEGPRCEVPPHTKGVASDRSAGWERTKAASIAEQSTDSAAAPPADLGPVTSHPRCTPLLGAYTYCTMQWKASPPPPPSSP